MKNQLLESRLGRLRESLDSLANLVDDNLRTVLLRLTCDDAAWTDAPLTDVTEPAKQMRERCLMLIAREHPVAHDLKFSMAALRVGHDYERIQELAEALNERVVKLRGTPMEDVIQDMTGVMADILKMHEFVRKTWQSDREDPRLSGLMGEVKILGRAVLGGVTKVEQKTLDAIAAGNATPSNMVELVLACRHLKRIANLMESLPDELHSFEKFD